MHELVAFEIKFSILEIYLMCDTIRPSKDKSISRLKTIEAY